MVNLLEYPEESEKQKRQLARKQGAHLLYMPFLLVLLFVMGIINFFAWNINPDVLLNIVLVLIVIAVGATAYGFFLFVQNAEKKEIIKTTPSDKKEVKGFGWMLSVVFMGMIASIFASANGLITSVDIFSQEFGNTYSWAFVVEIILNAGILFLGLASLTFFALRNRIFPKTYIALLIFAPIAMLIDSVMARWIVWDILSQEWLREILVTGKSNPLNQTIASMVWIAYMKKSERVKNTFIR